MGVALNRPRNKNNLQSHCKMRIKKEPKDEKSSNVTIDDAANVTEKDQASSRINDAEIGAHDNVEGKATCINNDDAKLKPKRYNSSMKCFFPGCISTSKDKDIKWFGVQKNPTCPPQSKPRFVQVRKHHIKSKLYLF